MKRYRMAFVLIGLLGIMFLTYMIIDINQLQIRDNELGHHIFTAKLSQQLIRENPKDADGYYKLGLAYMDKKDFKSAITAFRQMEQISPLNAEYHYLAGWAYEYDNQHQIAKAELKRAIELDKFDTSVSQLAQDLMKQIH